MRTALRTGLLVVAAAGAVAVLLPSGPGPAAPLRSIDLGVHSPASPEGDVPAAAAPSAPPTVPQAPRPAPEPAPMPTVDDAGGDRDRDDRVEVGDDRDVPDAPDDDGPDDDAPDEPGESDDD